MAAAGVSGFHVLGGLDSIFVSQDFELWEVLSGCEMQNRYKVFAATPDGEKIGEPIFKAKEESGCLERQCCGPARSFEMNVFTAADMVGFIKLVRPFRCTCLCLNRSVIYVQSMAGEDLGEVYNPFQCCDNKLELGAPKPDREGGVNPLPIIASDGNYGDWYVVEANCCQPGFFCQCPCGPCKEIVWTITAPKAPDTPIGTIKRVWAGLCKQAFTDADNFVIQFPPGATPYQKATLMGCAFLIDFLLFEKKQNNGNSGGGV